MRRRKRKSTEKGNKRLECVEQLGWEGDGCKLCAPGWCARRAFGDELGVELDELLRAALDEPGLWGLG